MERAWAQASDHWWDTSSVSDSLRSAALTPDRRLLVFDERPSGVVPTVCGVVAFAVAWVALPMGAAQLQSPKPPAAPRVQPPQLQHGEAQRHEVHHPRHPAVDVLAGVTAARGCGGQSPRATAADFVTLVPFVAEVFVTFVLPQLRHQPVQAELNVQIGEMELASQHLLDVGTCLVLRQHVVDTRAK